MLLDPRISVSTLPGTKFPMRKILPTLGEATDNSKAKNEDDTKERDILILLFKRRSKQLVESSQRDEMKLHQPARAQPFPVGLVAQMLFFFQDYGTGRTTRKQSTDNINRISNGKNLRNNNGSYFSKVVAAEVSQYPNVDKNEETSFSMQTFQKKKFDVHESRNWE